MVGKLGKIMNGLPKKDMARPGVHIAQSEPNIVYLMTDLREVEQHLNQKIG